MNHTINPPIGSEQIAELLRILQSYKAGKARTEQRIISSENWWKLRNTAEEAGESDLFRRGFTSRSGWLHNVIVAKHADAMDAYPEPVILPREENDRAEASVLSAIVPCILEQNRFEETYSDAMWRKMKSGTAVYKIVWDPDKLGGLGDIGVESVSVLNLFWEPGVTDIQKSKYFFHTELWDKDVLCERYPELLRDGVRFDGFSGSKFLYDDRVDTENKATVVEAYYHKFADGKNTLHYVKFVGDTVLFATENETEPTIDELGNPMPPMAETGLYDHGKYPFVFDALFPMEGSPCGYGYVDICRNPQTEIDLLKTCFIRNARVGSIPRYFSRGDGAVNEEEFLDLENPIVHAAGGVDEAALRPIEHKPIDGSYLDLLQWNVNELRETSGNTETAAGISQTGVTAAAAIAALQEASGKGSRDSTLTTYRAYARIVEICVELIRQFYQIPRSFRILGDHGADRFVSYTNRGIRPVYQGVEFGQDMGMRLPVFDIRISAQKKDSYARAAQNELAMDLYKMGVFDPDKTEQAVACLEMMSFEGKDALIQRLLLRGGEKGSADTEKRSRADVHCGGMTDSARRFALEAALPYEK